jgi:hypothetical protein
MSDIDTILEEVKRLDAEASAPLPFCEMCYGHRFVLLNGVAAPCNRCPKHDLTELHAYYRTAAPLLAAEVERLRAEVERLTRDRERLTGYVRAALPLSRDAHTHLLEERPEETAQAIYRVICALASAEKEGDDQ